MRRSGRMVEGVADLAGLSRSHPLMAAAMAAFMFSMAGVPPLAGFWGKLYVFQAAVGAELYFLAVVGVLTSVVSCFYYLRIVKLMYFDEPAEAFVAPRHRGVNAVAAVTATLNSPVHLLLIWPLTMAAGAAAQSLFA